MRCLIKYIVFFVPLQAGLRVGQRPQQGIVSRSDRQMTQAIAHYRDEFGQFVLNRGAFDLDAIAPIFAKIKPNYAAIVRGGALMYALLGDGPYTALTPDDVQNLMWFLYATAIGKYQPLYSGVVMVEDGRGILQKILKPDLFKDIEVPPFEAQWRVGQWRNGWLELVCTSQKPVQEYYDASFSLPREIETHATTEKIVGKYSSLKESKPVLEIFALQNQWRDARDAGVAAMLKNPPSVHTTEYVKLCTLLRNRFDHVAMRKGSEVILTRNELLIPAYYYAHLATLSSEEKQIFEQYARFVFELGAYRKHPEVLPKLRDAAQKFQKADLSVIKNARIRELLRKVQAIVVNSGRDIAQLMHSDLHA